MLRPSDGWGGAGIIFFAFFIGCSCFGHPDGVSDGKRSRNGEVYRLESTVDELERKVRQLEARKSALEGDKERLDRKVRQLESEKQDLESKVRRLESVKRILEAESRELEDHPK